MKLFTELLVWQMILSNVVITFWQFKMQFWQRRVRIKLNSSSIIYKIFRETKNNLNAMDTKLGDFTEILQNQIIWR